jgi:hypothetical protein
MDTVEKRKISYPCREANPDLPVGSLSAIGLPTELFRLPEECIKALS